MSYPVPRDRAADSGKHCGVAPELVGRDGHLDQLDAVLLDQQRQDLLDHAVRAGQVQDLDLKERSGKRDPEAGRG